MVAAFRSATGASRWLLSAALRKHGISTVLSVPLFLEYESVLTRPENLAASQFKSQQVSAVLDALASASIHARFSFRWRPLLSDADDDMVMETAINGGANLLVTFNIRDFGSVGERFGCRVLQPREAVRLIG
jgi:predicted nucleic acid-binding protein